MDTSVVRIGNANNQNNVNRIGGTQFSDSNKQVAQNNQASFTELNGRVGQIRDGSVQQNGIDKR